ncbi:MAG: TIGR00701 family protein [Rickettsiales bacterium]|nr:TIGR00701 family protein [Rickettsiales bacterium]|tara:strand:- start:145 stop:576 length:432 start_codon:yes stop_codon:yes gene_type:complete
MFSTYLVLKSLHLISLIAWMAGMLYLPRLYVYHTQVEAGSETSQWLKIMERRLLRYIMNPAMIATWVFGVWLMIEINALQQGWMHGKLLLVVLMSGVHGMLSAQRRKFEADENTKSTRYFRILNEVPTVLMIAIIFLVVIKPF